MASPSKAERPKPSCQKTDPSLPVHWIPKEVYCPSVSAADGADHRYDEHDYDDTVSSIGASSATSRSSGRKNVGIHNQYCKDAAMAESTYSDLENEWGPLNQRCQEPRSPPTAPHGPVGDDDDDDSDAVDKTAHHETADFDPFLLHACVPGPEFYPTSMPQANDRSGETVADTGFEQGDGRVNNRCAPSEGSLAFERFVTQDRIHILGVARDGEILNGEPSRERNDDDDDRDDFEYPVAEARKPKGVLSSYSCLIGVANKEVPAVISITPRKTRRTQSRKKREKKSPPKTMTNVPLHARVEMLHHQTQKPFRMVSRMVLRSAKTLHDAIFQGPDPGILLTMGPSSFLNGNITKKHLSLNDSLGASSVPGAQKVTSLDSSDTGSWDEESECVSTSSRRRHSQDVAGRQEDIELDLRWLYARQLLPVAASFQRKAVVGPIHLQRSS